MKKGFKRIKIFVLILLTIFIGVKGVNAECNADTSRGELCITQSTPEAGGAYVNKKIGTSSSNSRQAYCLDGASVPAPPVGTVYQLQTENNNNIRYEYIILATKSEGIQFVEGAFVDGNHADGTSIVFPSTYNDDLDLFNSSGTITASPNKLDFQKVGTNYVASVTLSGYNFSDYGSCTLSGANGTINKENISNGSGKITITIPQSAISNDTNVTLTCSNAVQKYKTTEVYKCKDCSYQSVAVEKEGQKESNVIVNGQIKVDKKGSITITKYGKNYKGVKNKLSGVKFKIKNSNGKTINASGVEEENYIFTTDKGVIEIKNIEIPDRTKSYKYTVEEVSTLSGYARIIGTKEIVLNSANDFTYSNEFINETVKVTISKTDATGKKELPGAKLSILDKDGKILNKCIFDKENHLITYSDDKDAEACTWASTDKSYIFEGLPVGKYYLVEELAPEGYQKSTEKILIEIKEDGAVKDKIEMKNALKVPVPDTLSARSALLLVVAMFDIALGIGIVTYVKKHKTEE